MFWGMNLKANRKYSQTTTKSFHISHAALDSQSSQGGANQLYISCENQKFLICTLHKDKCEQVMLDLNFAVGDEICFQSVGSGNVTLCGYLIDDDDDALLNGEEEEEEVEDEDVERDLRETLNAKKAKSKKGIAAKAAQSTGDDEEDEEDDSDGLDIDASDDDNDDEDVQDEDDEEEDDDDEDDANEEDDDEEDSYVEEPKPKQPKLEKQQKQQKQQNGVVRENKKVEAVGEKKNKKDKKKGDHNKQQPQQPQQQKERVLSGGVKVVDVRIGNGAEAKQGKRTHVYYEGRLVSNNKVFDSMKTGPGFKFILGRGEVIKGWDIGVAGMKVGGKRRITCPPHMAYGSRGSPPTIPPNSTLVFEVELKNVN